MLILRGVCRAEGRPVTVIRRYSTKFQDVRQSDACCCIFENPSTPLFQQVSLAACVDLELCFKEARRKRKDAHSNLS